MNHRCESGEDTVWPCKFILPGTRDRASEVGSGQMASMKVYSQDWGTLSSLFLIWFRGERPRAGASLDGNIFRCGLNSVRTLSESCLHRTGVDLSCRVVIAKLAATENVQ